MLTVDGGNDRRTFQAMGLPISHILSLEAQRTKPSDDLEELGDVMDVTEMGDT